MMKNFYVNGNFWKVKFVDDSSEYLIDRTGKSRAATTDPQLNTIFLSKKLHGDFLKTVLIHEMTHVVLWEYDIISRIHKYCYPEHRIDMEEEICNILADYGEFIYETAYTVMGGKAIFVVPYGMERLVA